MRPRPFASPGAGHRAAASKWLRWARGTKGGRTRAGIVLAGALAVSAGLPGPAAAASWYQVEVVLFSHGGEAAWNEGKWRAEGPPPIPENAVELLESLGTSAGSNRRFAFRKLRSSSLGLRAAVARLEASPDHRVLLHVGWQQPVEGRKNAPGVHFGTRRRTAGDERFTVVPKSVDGIVRLWRQRFLHADVDFGYGELEPWLRSAPPPSPGSVDEAGSPSTGDAAPPRAARISRTLRLRPGRLHYIDHSLFGLLVLAKRL